MTKRDKVETCFTTVYAGNKTHGLSTVTANAIRKWLGWRVSVSDRYLSNPLVGRKSNDILLTTGLRLSFAKLESANSLKKVV